MARRLQRVLGARTHKAQRTLVAEILHDTGRPYPPSLVELTSMVAASASFERATTYLARHRAPIHMALRPPKFAPVARFAAIEVPKLPTSGNIAKWLGLTIEELDWFADAKCQHGRTAIPDLQHYKYAFRAKAFGPPRLIEAPKPRLKTIQRRILTASSTACRYTKLHTDSSRGDRVSATPSITSEQTPSSVLTSPISS